MCNNCRKYTRRLDAFSQPVGISYKSQFYFSSGCGSCLTVTIALFIIAYLVPTLYKLFLDPEFTHTQICNYKSFMSTEDDPSDKLDTLQYNLPFEIHKNSRDGTPSSSLVRLQYYIATKEKGD